MDLTQQKELNVSYISINRPNDSERMSTEKLSADLTDSEEQWSDGAIRKRRKLAKKMQKPVQITANPPEQEAFILNLLTKKIPLLAGFLQSLKSTGSSITSLLIKTQDSSSQALNSANAGFQYAALGLSAINFVRIPLIFLFAIIAGEKPPFTLSTGASWAYSALLLGLTITALLVPVAAPYIAVAIAGISLITSVISLGNMIYQRYKLKHALAKTNDDIQNNEAILDDIQQRARILETQLASLNKEDKNYQKSAAEICKKIDKLEQHYLRTKTELQILHDKKLLDEKTLSGIGVTAFLDKGVGIALASLTVIGAVLSLFFPPVGVGILLASAAMGTLYLIGRIVVPIVAPVIVTQVKKLGEWLANAFENKKGNKLTHDLDSTLTSQSQASPTEPTPPSSAPGNEAPSVSSSTLIAMKGLFGKGAGEQLRLLGQDAAEMELLDNQLLKIAERGNPIDALNFFRNLAVIAQIEDCSHGDLHSLFNKFSNMNKVLPLLDKALEDIESGALVLSDAEKSELRASKPFMVILQHSERSLDMDVLGPSPVNHDQEESEQLSLKRVL